MSFAWTRWGHDDREFWGNWNYWADFAANQGAVVYNATDGPAGTATNDVSKWNYNQWQTFNPGLFGGVYSSGDDKTDGCCILYSLLRGNTARNIRGRME